MAEKIDSSIGEKKTATADAGAQAPRAAEIGGAAAAGQGEQASRDAAAPREGKEISREKLEELVVDALRTVYDPEIPVNIYDLGLIYDLRIDEGKKVAVKMTLTTPACPIAAQMPGMVEQAVRHVDDVAECEVDLVWDPPWNPDMMTEAARLQLNI